jgi:hypothetical protein
MLFQQQHSLQLQFGHRYPELIITTTSHRSFYQDLAIAIPHELSENDGFLTLSKSLKLKLQNGTLRKHLANDLRISHYESELKVIRVIYTGHIKQNCQPA